VSVRSPPENAASLEHTTTATSQRLRTYQLESGRRPKKSLTGPRTWGDCGFRVKAVSYRNLAQAGKGDHEEWFCPCGQHMTVITKPGIVSPGLVRYAVERLPWPTSVDMGVHATDSRGLFRGTPGAADQPIAVTALDCRSGSRITTSVQ